MKILTYSAMFRITQGTDAQCVLFFAHQRILHLYRGNCIDIANIPYAQSSVTRSYANKALVFVLILHQSTNQK
jgi:hypothetical protein